MERFSEVAEVLGTRVEVVVYAEGARAARALFDKAFDECLRLENLYSRFKKGNYLDALNSCVGEKMQVSKEMYELLKYAQELFDVTNGIFDIRVKSVLEGAGYDADYSFVKKNGVETIDNSKSGIELFPGNFIRLSNGVEIGGFGKGYLLDLIKEQFCEVENFMVNAGGDIYAKGKDLAIGEWRVAFENPLSSEEVLGVVEVDDFFLASSSPKHRSWGDSHHLIDMRNGEAAKGMLAVYTQAESGICADAYSTALFVMGFERARDFLLSRVQISGNQKGPRSLDMQTLEAMLVSPRGEIFRSGGFRGDLFKS